MNSSELTCSQAIALHDNIAPTQGYLHRVIDRMDERGFPYDDKLRRLVIAARDALHSLTVYLHYQSCGLVDGGNGIGRHLANTETAESCDVRESELREHKRRRGRRRRR